MNNRWFWRLLFYFIGLVVLAIGLTLNTKSGLGVSPIISIPFAISNIFHIDFGSITFVVYIILTLIQFILKGKDRDFFDFFQIPFSLVFGVLLNFFGKIFDLHYDLLWQNLILLALAIVATAIGASMMVNMKFIPNPADNLAKTIGDRLKKDMGFGKNLLDVICVSITCIGSLIFAKSITAIGIGTICSMIFVGRVIALFNHFCKRNMEEKAGLI